MIVVALFVAACKAIVDELSYEVKKVDPKKTIQVCCLGSQCNIPCMYVFRLEVSELIQVGSSLQNQRGALATTPATHNVFASL